MQRVLVIEDDANVREVAARFLSSAGFIVMAAADGAKGYDMFCRSRPDCVLTDIIMPNREGVETIRAIRQIDPTVPIVAMSGGGRAGVMDFLQVAMKLGATRALAKPFSGAGLVAAVKEAMSGAAEVIPPVTIMPA